MTWCNCCATYVLLNLHQSAMEPASPEPLLLFGSAECTAWAVVALLYGGCVVLHHLIPQRACDGYVWDTANNRPLQYRNNGLKVHVALVAVAVLAVRIGLVDGAFLYDHIWACVRAALGYSTLLSTYFFVEGRMALSADAKNRNNDSGIDRNVCTPTTSRRVVEQDSTEYVCRRLAACCCPCVVVVFTAQVLGVVRCSICHDFNRQTAHGFDACFGALGAVLCCRRFDSRSAAEHFWCGARFNPRPRFLGGADVKMMLCVRAFVCLAAGARGRLYFDWTFCIRDW